MTQSPTWITITGFIVGLIGVLYAAIINGRFSYGSKLVDRLTAVESREQGIEEKFQKAREDLLKATSDLLRAQLDNERLVRENDQLTTENKRLQSQIVAMQVQLSDLVEKYDLLQKNYALQFPDADNEVIGIPPPRG